VNSAFSTSITDELTLLQSLRHSAYQLDAFFASGHNQSIRGSVQQRGGQFAASFLPTPADNSTQAGVNVQKLTATDLWQDGKVVTVSDGLLRVEVQSHDVMMLRLQAGRSG